jgi:acetyl esterase/lipase
MRIMNSSRRRVVWFILSLAPFLIAAVPARAAAQSTHPSYTRKQDIVYGRTYGTALTLDVFTPADHRNRAAVILIVSGGWISSHDAIGPMLINVFIRPFLDHGDTVFAVVHGSQPKFTLAEIRDNIDRAVRFVRANSNEFGIDPNRIAITGGSAGGHLSLLQATDPGRPHLLSFDRVERASGDVQAVGVFFPPTDFLNWGEPGHIVTHGEGIRPFMAAFDFREMSRQTGKFEPVPQEQDLRLLRELSPINHVSSHTPPTLIIHGGADTLVPLQQSKSFIRKLEEAHVECQLMIKPGAGHGWIGMGPDVERIADFFDAHLPPHATTVPTTAPARQP